MKEKAFFAVLLVIVTFGLCNSASATLVGVAEASKVDALRAEVFMTEVRNGSLLTAFAGARRMH